MTKRKRDEQEAARTAGVPRHLVPAYHVNPQRVYEHGQAWIVCNSCGATWSDDGRNDPEIVDEGDGYCEENAELV